MGCIRRSKPRKRSRSNSRRKRSPPSFFFSSRSRHTSSYGDWSSDVCSSDLANRAWQRQHGHGGKRFAAALCSDAQDDEKHGQNEKDDGANGTNENLTWQFQSDYAGKERRIAPITKWWWPTAAARAMENLSRSSARTIRRNPLTTAR